MNGQQETVAKGATNTFPPQGSPGCLTTFGAAQPVGGYVNCCAHLLWIILNMAAAFYCFAVSEVFVGGLLTHFFMQHGKFAYG